MPSWHAGKLGKRSVTEEAERVRAVRRSAWQGVLQSAEQAVAGVAVLKHRACYARGVKAVTAYDGVTVMHDRPRDCACMATPCGHAETCALIEADGSGNLCTKSARHIPVFGNYRTYLAIDRLPCLFLRQSNAFRNTHVDWAEPGLDPGRTPTWIWLRLYQPTMPLPCTHDLRNRKPQ